MKITELLKIAEPSFSFEFFPPKTDEGVKNLFDTVAALRPLEPSYVSVTYGAGGSTRSRTIELVRRIKSELHIETVAHLTCVGATREDIASVLDEVVAGGIDNVLALRGDPPRGQTTFQVTDGGFRYADELVAFIKGKWPLGIGVAAYPEGHPESTNRFDDMLALKRKVDAGAEFIVTQLFFDNSYYFDFVAQARRLGITVPIIPGIMPITNVDQIERFTSVCKTSIPDRLRRELSYRREDPQSALELGVAYATLQCSELLRRGAPGVHFFTLNKSSATRAILAALRASRPWTERVPGSV